MMSELASVLPIAEAGLWGIWWVFLRVGAIMAMLPAFGEQSVPLRIRLGLGVAFTLVIFPAAVTLSTGMTSAPSFVATISELLVGLMFGLFLRFFVMVLQIAGTIAAQSTSLSQIFGGSAGFEPLPAMGHVLVVAGLALATILGLHVHAAEYMLLSYQLVPPGVIPSADVVAEIGVQEVGRTFALSFTLAAPFVIASLLYNVTLGVINRAMPQLMVAFVGAPAITAGGLALLAIAAPILLGLWSDKLFAFMANPFGGPP
ncbi:flagellar biosynthetic protein FliR [Roseisalinus antarcticus]|uniref:Flagellar biosynthesis protein FliR n=1 Tax=Roseisalinus antarcticus TaxID=254357 RepID=A0A1Y5TKV6_9RHOB|nr:flagellar biosynthetic protein FliR [Roseisalinus antarcticus]SLN62737.1 flagellar biosynthesis protein FliR [Roseisalinus antarcticus]